MLEICAHGKIRSTHFTGTYNGTFSYVRLHRDILSLGIFELFLLYFLPIFYHFSRFWLGGGTGTYGVPLRASTPSRDWSFQAPEIMGGQGRRGPHV